MKAEGEIKNHHGHHDVEFLTNTHIHTKKQLIGHAYHQNLPSHYIDDDGVSKVTKYAHRKARAIVRLVHSIQLTEDLYNETAIASLGASSEGDEDDAMDVDDDDIDDDDIDDDNEEELDEFHHDTLVSSIFEFIFLLNVGSTLFP